MEASLAQKLMKESMSCVSGRCRLCWGLVCEEAGGVSGEGIGDRGVAGLGERGGVIASTWGVVAAAAWMGLPGRDPAEYLLIRDLCHRSSGKMLWPRIAVDTTAASSCCIADIGGKIHPDLVHA